MVAELLLGCLAFPAAQIRGGLLQQRQVVLSFDDGPNDVTSPLLLDVLAANGVKALFFHVGVNINNPALMRRFLSEGHCVGVHTMGHAHLTSLSREDAHLQIDDSIQRFQNVTGSYPRFFRPPYGEVNAEITQYIHDKGMVSYMWDFDSNDWQVHSDLAARIGGRLHSHGIVLMHEYTWTTDEVQQIIDAIRDHGFEIVHPLELLSAEDTESLKAVACPSSLQAWCRYTTSNEEREL